MCQSTAFLFFSAPGKEDISNCETKTTCITIVYLTGGDVGFLLGVHHGHFRWAITEVSTLLK